MTGVSTRANTTTRVNKRSALSHSNQEGVCLVLPSLMTHSPALVLVLVLVLAVAVAVVVVEPVSLANCAIWFPRIKSRLVIMKGFIIINHHNEQVDVWAGPLSLVTMYNGVENNILTHCRDKMAAILQLVDEILKFLQKHFCYAICHRHNHYVVRLQGPLLLTWFSVDT